jgi:hypothetical protein
MPGFRATVKKRKKLMKIYLLMILIGVIVGLSYLPIRGRAKQTPAAPPDSLPA